MFCMKIFLFFFFQDSKTIFTNIGVNFFTGALWALFRCLMGEFMAEVPENPYKWTLIVTIIIQNSLKSTIVPDVRKWSQTKVAVTGSPFRKSTQAKKKKNLASFHHFHTNVLLAALHIKRYRFSVRWWEIRISLHYWSWLHMWTLCRMTHLGLGFSQAVSQRFRWWIAMLTSQSFSQL